MATNKVIGKLLKGKGFIVVDLAFNSRESGHLVGAASPG